MITVEVDEVDEEGTFWYKEGTNILHREDSPAIECSEGYKAYFINGKRHREDGPAVEHPSGYKEYWINGNLHREDGPAVKWSNGDKEYWINGKELTEEEFNNRNKVFTKEQLKKMSIEEFHTLIS